MYVQLLLGHTKIENRSVSRHRVDDTLEIAENIGI